jgi:hypothetical protein
MLKIAIAASMLAIAGPAIAQEAAPSTWRDPDTKCVYLKVKDTLSLRHRNDGSPDCEDLAQIATGAAISRNNLLEIIRSIEDLRRDINGIRRGQEDLQRELQRSR